VKIDDELGGPRWLGRPPVLSDSELVCVAVAQAMLGFTSEAHWLRYARKHLASLFPYLPQQSGCNKRLRGALGRVKRVIRMLARSTDFWLDACWIVDSTPCPVACRGPRSSARTWPDGPATAIAPRTGVRWWRSTAPRSRGRGAGSG